MTPAPDHHRHLVMVGGDAISDNDGWLHEDQSTDDDPDPKDIPAPRGTSKTEAKRLRDLEERKSQGDREDYRHFLDRLPGYRLAPERTLSTAQKSKRSKSINAAIKRRSERRWVTQGSDEARVCGPGRRDFHPKPKSWIGHYGGTHPDELYMHPYLDGGPALGKLCHELALYVTYGDAAVAGAVAFKSAADELGDKRHSPGKLEALFREHVVPHGEYQHWV